MVSDTARLFPPFLELLAGSFVFAFFVWLALSFSSLSSISSPFPFSFNFPSSSRSDLFLSFSCSRAYSNCAMVALIVLILSSVAAFLGLTAWPLLQLIAMQLVQCLFPFLHSQGALPFPVHDPSGLHRQQAFFSSFSSTFPFFSLLASESSLRF